MGRLHHLRETLRHNIGLVEKLKGVELVILDYNSQDGLESWAECELAGPIRDGVVNYYRTELPSFFHMAHGKNVAHRVAMGDIVCNLDADNFLSNEFIEFVSNTFQHSNERLFLAPQEYDGAYGRLVIPKYWFERLGGYDEDFEWGWGYEDDDLRHRARILGLEEKTIPPNTVSSLEHSEEERVKNSKLKDKAESKHRHETMSHQKRNSGMIIANVNRRWGSARLVKNFTDALEI